MAEPSSRHGLARDGLVLRQMAAALAGGLAPREAAEVLLPADHALARGEPLEAVLQRSGGPDGPAAARWLAAAAGSGVQAAAMAALADDLALRDQARRRVRQVLAWPMKLLVLGALLWIGVALRVVPAYVESYGGFGGSLPALSQMLLQSPLAAVVPAAMLLLALLIWAWGRDRLPVRIGTLAAASGERLPFVRRQRQARQAVRLAALLQAHGAQPAVMAAALGYLRVTAGTPARAAQAQRLEQACTSGTALSDAIEADAPLLARQVRLGERLRDVPGAMSRWLPWGTAEWESSMLSCEQGLLALAYGVLALALGGLVVAIYLPIFSLAGIV